MEWDTRKKAQYGERAFDKDSMKGANPKCPQQLNFSDCGIYVLQYVESFFEVRVSFCFIQSWLFIAYINQIYCYISGFLDVNAKGKIVCKYAIFKRFSELSFYLEFQAM